jgi:peptidoglycan/LPS O-acetylase OafA/YrhL
MQHHPRLPMPQAAALEGLRGMAALMVIASHASGLGLDLIPGLSLTGIGKQGVYLFFALSAFLLTWQWLATWPAQASALWPRLGDYLIGRVARIFPLYALVLLLAFTLGGSGLGVSVDHAGLWQHLLLLRGDGIYWSIPVEFHYYLVLPLLAALLHALRRPAVMLLLIGALIGGAMLAWPATQAPQNSDAIGYYLPVLLAGSAAAWVQTRWQASNLARYISGARGFADALLLLLLVLTIPALAITDGERPPDFLHHAYLGWGVTWALTLLGLLNAGLPMWARLLGSRALRQCGRWSFGLYLLHLPALYVVRLLPLPSLLAAWLGLALAMALAGLAYRLVERPALRACVPLRRALLLRSAGR